MTTALWIVALIVTASGWFYLLVARRRAQYAASVALDVAERALEHDEMGLGVASEIMDEEEVDDERAWISDQRATLERIRPMVRMPGGSS